MRCILLSIVLLARVLPATAQGVDETIWPQKLEIDYVRVYQPAADTAVDEKTWGTVKKND